MATITGRLLHSFTASSAARHSCRSVMVSTITRSAPADTAARTISLKMPTASSNWRVPVGSSSWPMGPTSRATRARPAAACFARATAAGTTSSTVLPVRRSFSRLAPKVLAQRIWLPAST